MWETVVAILLLGLFIWDKLTKEPRLKNWVEAAESCGLRNVVATDQPSLQLRARSELSYVRMSTIDDKGGRTRIVVDGPVPPGFQSITLRPDPMLRRAEEIKIGDRSFEENFSIQGPAPLVLALLDAQTRWLLTELKQKCEMELTSSELRAYPRFDLDLVDTLSLLLDIRKRFAPPVDLPQRLFANATGDPEPGVRLHNLLALVQEHSKNPWTAKALRASRSDPAPEIRLRAVTTLGVEAEDRDVLLELAESLEEDDVSAEALSLLDRQLPFERLNAILGLALRRRRLRSARVCLEAIGRREAAAGVDLLAKVLERERGELAPAAAEALGATRSPAAEPSLIEALQRDGADLRLAAARALGRVGTAAAVLPLKETAERSGLDRELRRAARQAIAEIQARLQGATPGQLSLAGAEAGQLSMAGAEAGQLSMAQDEAGQLSLTEDAAGQLSLPPEERPA